LVLFDIVFGIGLINGDIYIYPRLTSVAITTKFGTQLAFVRDFGEIFALQESSRGWAIKCRQSYFPRLTPVAMATKFEIKSAITRFA